MWFPRMQGDLTGFNPEIPKKGQNFSAGISLKRQPPLFQAAFLCR